MDSGDSPPFGAVLKRHRLAAGLTHEALAERAGLSARAISDLERGVARAPRPASLRLLADALGLGPETRAALVVAARPPPPVLAGPAARHNLRPQPTSFVGREAELATVRDLLARHRLVTLTGAGGCGKTRLALQAAAAALPGYPDGVWLVELATLRDPARVANAVAQAIGASDSGAANLQAVLEASLAGKRLLLVLDNFEHVLPAAALLSALLAACPSLKALVTSRAPLRLLGEQEYAVPPLRVPVTDGAAPGAGARQSEPAAEYVAQFDAVRLFVRRAQAMRADFRVCPENAAAVAELCRRLDGLPLALELAAARLRLLSPEALLERLDRRLPLLTTGARDAPHRHRTLREAIAWSHALLAPEEQALFRRLAVFAGGSSLEAVEAVCAGQDERRSMDDEPAPPLDSGATSVVAPAGPGWALRPQDVLDRLEALVEHSLVRQDDRAGGEPRFAMLETIREYAQEQLHLSGETEHGRARHAAYYLALARAALHQFLGPAQLVWLDRFEREHDNLRAALRWYHAHARAGDAPAAQQGLDLAQLLMWFSHVRGYHREAWEWLMSFLALPAAAARTGERARALYAAGWLAWPLGEYETGRLVLDECGAIWHELGDEFLSKRALTALGRMAIQRGALAEARAYFEAFVPALDAHRTHPVYPFGRAQVHSYLGMLAVAEGDVGEARRQFEQGLALGRATQHAYQIAWSNRDLASLAHLEGEADRARSLYEESLGLFRDLGDRTSEAMVLREAGGAALAVGDHAAARRRMREAVVAYQRLGSARGVGAVLGDLAALVAAEGDFARALRLAGAGAALQRAGGTLITLPGPARDDAWRLAARRALGPVAAAREEEAGAALSLETAVAYALEGDAPQEAAAAGAPSMYRVTAPPRPRPPPS